MSPAREAALRALGELAGVGCGHSGCSGCSQVPFSRMSFPSCSTSQSHAIPFVFQSRK